MAESIAEIKAKLDSVLSCIEDIKELKQKQTSLEEKNKQLEASLEFAHTSIKELREKVAVQDETSLWTILAFLFCIFVTMYICIYVMILGFLFFIQTFLKYCKALSTEKYKRYINILLLLLQRLAKNLPHLRRVSQQESSISTALLRSNISRLIPET